MESVLWNKNPSLRRSVAKTPFCNLSYSLTSVPFCCLWALATSGDLDLQKILVQLLTEVVENVDYDDKWMKRTKCEVLPSPCWCVWSCICWEVIRPLIMSLFILSSVNALSLSQPYSLMHFSFPHGGINSTGGRGRNEQRKWLNRVGTVTKTLLFTSTHTCRVTKACIDKAPSSFDSHLCLRSLDCEIIELNITFRREELVTLLMYWKHLSHIPSHWISFVLFTWKSTLDQSKSLPPPTAWRCDLRQFVALEKERKNVVKRRKQHDDALSNKYTHMQN